MAFPRFPRRQCLLLAALALILYNLYANGGLLVNGGAQSVRRGGSLSPLHLRYVPAAQSALTRRHHNAQGGPSSATATTNWAQAGKGKGSVQGRQRTVRTAARKTPRDWRLVRLTTGPSHGFHVLRGPQAQMTRMGNLEAAMAKGDVDLDQEVRLFEEKERLFAQQASAAIRQAAPEPYQAREAPAPDSVGQAQSAQVRSPRRHAGSRGRTRAARAPTEHMRPTSSSRNLEVSDAEGVPAAQPAQQADGEATTRQFPEHCPPGSCLNGAKCKLEMNYLARSALPSVLC